MLAAEEAMFSHPALRAVICNSHMVADEIVQYYGVDRSKLHVIYNGVDTQRFHPAAGGRAGIEGSPFKTAETWCVGTVGRLQHIKNQVLLAKAFVRALELAPQARAELRLIIAGDGPELGAVQAVLRDAGVLPLAWLAGQRNDVPDVLRGLDAFVLPSRAEGVSNTILEAMASGLPIVATAVGGNVELLEEGVTGRLVPSDDIEVMARAILEDFGDRHAARERGRRARAMAERRFSLDAMVGAYADLYESQLERHAAKRLLQQA